MRASILTNSIRNDYVATPVLTSAWVQLSASLPHDTRKLEVFDSSGQTMKLGYGVSGSEVDFIQILPGGNGPLDVVLNKGMRLAVRAVSADATAGELTINFYR